MCVLITLLSSPHMLGRVSCSSQDHRFSFLFTAFPDHFRLFGSKQSMYNQIGNAVPPGLARFLARAFLVADAFAKGQGLSARENASAIPDIGVNEPLYSAPPDWTQEAEDLTRLEAEEKRDRYLAEAKRHQQERLHQEKLAKLHASRPRRRARRTATSRTSRSTESSDLSDSDNDVIDSADPALTSSTERREVPTHASPERVVAPLRPSHPAARKQSLRPLDSLNVEPSRTQDRKISNSDDDEPSPVPRTSVPPRRATHRNKPQAAGSQPSAANAVKKRDDLDIRTGPLRAAAAAPIDLTSDSE
jgi:hypothetical protein